MLKWVRISTHNFKPKKGRVDMMSDYALEEQEKNFLIYMQELEAGFWGEDRGYVEGKNDDV
jgi:hypothetical protein